MDHLYFVVHTHWDREWYQPFQQMRARLVRMADRMIPLVERGQIPFFHFDGQTIVLEDYLELRPKMERRLRALIRAGKIQVGPWYVLADSFLVSGEALIRNLEIGMAIARRFGRPLGTGYLPDQFGHIAQMPQILAGFGFRSAVLWRGVGADVTRSRFEWEALDGGIVRTAYLPFGYSNGANLPLESVDTFLKRAETIVERGRAFAKGEPILVMTGTDHAEPDPRLQTRINEAREGSPLEFEIGPLEAFTRRVEAAPVDGIPRHRGELRSPLRAHLLPGVTSARTWIKQRDFENCAALERFAEPLAALANALGRGEGLNDYLELAWRLELQNHPHDSICGCSVDQVHRDMRYRFDQAAMIAETVVRRATSAILGSASAAKTVLAVFNPTFSRFAMVSGQVELPDPSARYVVEARDGSRIPVAVDSVRDERAIDTTFPAAEFQATIAGLSQPSVLGRTVNRYEITPQPDGGPLLTLWLSRAAHSDIDLEQLRHAVRTQMPESGTVSVRAVNAASCRIEFVARDLQQVGLSFFALKTDESTPDAAGVARGFIENEFYRVQPSANGIEIRDRARGTVFELHFEDEGDRGDEYNFDPISGDVTIVKPARISSRIETEAAREQLMLALEFDLPAAIFADRSSRSLQTEKLTVYLTTSLYRGLDRVDFEARVVNNSRDHRFRAALCTPILRDVAIQDTSFGVLKRPVCPTEPRGTEDIYPTAPHRTFSAVESESASVALMSRGIYEAEVRPGPAGSTILLTLLRCVGWLSRSDLRTRRGGAGPELETPEAQELGEHRFQFAMTGYAGQYDSVGLVGRAQAYAYPPRIVSGSATSLDSMEKLAECDNPRIAFSAAQPLAEPETYRLRVFNSSSSDERARFSFPPGFLAHPVDLAGRRLRPRGLKRDGDRSIEFVLKAFQILTMELSRTKGSGFKKNSSRGGQND